MSSPQEGLTGAEEVKPKSRLEHIVHELVSTEKDYVEKLTLLVEVRSLTLHLNITGNMKFVKAMMVVWKKPEVVIISRIYVWNQPQGGCMELVIITGHHFVTIH